MVDWATKPLALNRGADIVNVQQGTYDFGYFGRFNPTIFKLDAEECGPYISSSGAIVVKPGTPKSVKKQRWETLAVAIVFMFACIGLRWLSFPLFSFMPHFFGAYLAGKYGKSEWQTKLFARLNALVLNPRGLIQMQLVVALHEAFQKPVNMMDRTKSSGWPSGHNLPLCLYSTWDIYAPLWEGLARD